MKKAHLFSVALLALVLIFSACEKEPDVVLPTVETTEVVNITQQKATANCNVTNDGGDEGVVRGVCWSAAADPTIDDNKAEEGTGSGAYTVDITGLAPGATYHARAYATNSEGTSYGADVEFQTPVK